MIKNAETERSNVYVFHYIWWMEDWKVIACWREILGDDDMKHERDWRDLDCEALTILNDEFWESSFRSLQG